MGDQSHIIIIYALMLLEFFFVLLYILFYFPGIKHLTVIITWYLVPTYIWLINIKYKIQIKG